MRRPDPRLGLDLEQRLATPLRRRPGSLSVGPALLQLDLLPAGIRPAARTLPVIGHGEFRLLLRQLAPEPPAGARSLQTTTPLPLPPRSSTSWSRPLHADHAELAAVEAATVQVARARRSPGRPPATRCVGRFADGVEVLKDGTELNLASVCLADAELHLEGAGVRGAQGHVR